MMITPATPEYRPLYEQIKTLIMDSLAAGEWRPGEVIPSETELAVRYKVSQGTMRKAIDELAKENILVRRQGKGTFVATHSAEHTQYHFMRVSEHDGEFSIPSSELLQFSRAKADDIVAEKLNLKRGAGIIALQRVLRIKEQKVILDDIFLPVEIFKGLSAPMIKEYPGTLYSLFETRYDTRIIRAKERLSAIAADDATARLLEVAPGHPLLLIERQALTYGSKPVEWRRSHVKTTHHNYYNELG